MGDAGDRTQVGHVLGKCPPYYATALDLGIDFLMLHVQSEVKGEEIVGKEEETGAEETGG